MKPLIYMIHLQGTPINKQLELEETLLKDESKNFCLINSGAPRALVLGLTGKEEEWITPEFRSKPKAPIFRRFSAGGTVAVDQNTLFLTFICRKNA